MEIQRILSFSIKLILFLSIFNAINLKLWHIMSTNIFLLILVFLPDLLKKSYRVQIPKEFNFLLLIFVVLTLFLGRVNTAIVPLAFGIAIAFIGFLIMLILYSNDKIKKDYFLIILFAFCLSVTFGVALELLKYYLKMILGYTIGDGSYIFTMRNMTFVTLGAGITSILGLIYMKTRKGIGKIVEKFEKINPKLFQGRNPEGEIQKLIQKGEDEKLEFKETLRVNTYTKEIDRRIEYSALKTLTAFLNSEGGILLIGVSNSGEITGIEKDNFENTDRFLLHFTNLIKEKIGKRYLHLINHEVRKVNNKEILKVECSKSNRPIFLKGMHEEEFYIRVGPSSNKIEGSELVDYIQRKFK